MCLAAVIGIAGQGADGTASFREWYVPNGIATRKDTTPATGVYDVNGYSQEWIHVLNLAGEDAAVTLTFYTETKPPKSMSITVPAGRHKPLFLREGQLQGMVEVNQLYGLRVTSDREVMVQVTRHESEENAIEIPSNQLQSNLGYPGPLGHRETAWMYVDCWSLTSDPTWIEKEWLNVLNPSDQPAELTITFINRVTGVTTQCRRTIEAARMFTLNLVSLPPEIYREHVGYSVMIESNVPVVPMQIRRFFHTQNQSPRGLIGIIPFPLGDRRGAHRPLAPVEHASLK